MTCCFGRLALIALCLCLSAFFGCRPVAASEPVGAGVAGDSGTAPPAAPDLKTLVERYAPVLYFHPDEIFRPQPVAVLFDTARVRRVRPRANDVLLAAHISPGALSEFQDASIYLDVWLGNEGSSDYRNYTSHRAYYAAHLSPEAGGPPVATYARVMADEILGRATIQYWFFYWYNDWANKHEGDWEMIEVMLGEDARPRWAVYSQHHGGTRRAWADMPVEGGTHPVVFVALGSHANYFRGDEIFPHGGEVGSSRVDVVDRTGRAGRAAPEVILLPESCDASIASWLAFGGRWGESAALSDFSGPIGPCQKGEQWNRPFAWGMAQPTDLEEWYENRVRVDVTNLGAQIRLIVNGDPELAAVEERPGSAVLHGYPEPGTVVRAEIDSTGRRPYEIVAAWPDPDLKRVMRYVFSDVPPGMRSELLLSAGAMPQLVIEETGRVLFPAATESESIGMDAPDFIWMGAGLPVGAVAGGVAASLLAGLLPALIYLGVLYYADRYEKEPAGLVIGAFVWGAVPAVAVAMAATVFFKLPVDLLGQDVVEAVRVGVVAPLVEETLKAVVILFIFHRYRFEIDSMLDGILYGAAVGLGFAMMANTISYLGAFLLNGFTDLGQKVFVDGFLYGLNQAFYSAIFGASLAFVFTVRSRAGRILIPLAGFALAVLCNGLHGVLVQNAVGVSLATLPLTWLGVCTLLTTALWSVRQQRCCLERQLEGEVPDDLRRTLLSERARAVAEWRALVKQGPRGLRRTRRLFQQCAELAFRKAQSAARPRDVALCAEVALLRERVARLLGEAPTVNAE